MSNIGYSNNLGGIDTSMIKTQVAHNPMAIGSKFDNIMGKVDMGLNMAAPTIGVTLGHFGQNKGAAYVGAALTGFSGAGGMAAPGYSSQPYTGSWGATPGLSKNLMPGAPPGYSGGGAAGGMGAPPGFGGATSGMGSSGFAGGQPTAQFDNQINEMMNNNLVFLSLQTKVQNVSQTTQMMSNINKTHSDAVLNAVRNMRA